MICSSVNRDRFIFRLLFQGRILPKNGGVLGAHVKRYIVACYEAERSGFFRPHRDNTTKGTAHRRFAVTINLNAEAYEEGELRFPEFGSAIFKAPTGCALVFSCSLLHEVLPVTKGQHFAFLPFLYDEAGANIRAENNHFLSDDIETYKRRQE
jgi:predicted 2-oxoglutarate/Fe(II)-dependent dioxygenase YbiX